MIIVNTLEKLVIGNIYENGSILHPDGEYKKAPLKVLSLASKQEYIDFCKDQNVDHLIKYFDLSENHLFYKIEVLD